MTRYSVEQLTERPGSDVVELLAAAYIQNPLHLAAFPGSDEARLDSNRRLFCLATSGMLQGTWLGVKDGDALLGVLHHACSPACAPPPQAREQLGTVMTASLGEAGDRVAQWFKSWFEVHPGGDHWHVGPFGVTPDCQGRGIGSLLMAECCRRIDAARGIGYLETDEPENVGFYEKFGFRVTREAEVLGVRNWFMERTTGGTP
jgi:ribosomal protein S18 acetylase RimI-like enzyme